MKQEQNFRIRINDNMHSKLHQNNIEHEIYDEDLMTTITFDVDRAAKYFNLDENHTLNTTMSVWPKILMDKNKPFYRASTMGDAPEKLEFRTESYDLMKYVLDKVFTNKSTVVDLAEYFDTLDEHAQLMEQLEPERERKQQVINDKHAKEKAEREAQKERDREAQRKHQQEVQQHEDAIENHMNTFLETNASEHLKKCTQKGYNCWKATIKEMINYYLGENWVLDYNGKVDVKDRSCPSEKAIDTQIEIENKNIDFLEDIKVKWLPYAFEQLNPDPEPDYVDGIEAIEAKYMDRWVYLPIEE